MYPLIYRTLRLLWPGGLESQLHLRELKKTQWFSHADLEAWQLARLQHLVQYAYENVPYYHERYQREGIHPQDIKSLQDLQCLPIITKADINQHLESFVCPQLRSQAQPSLTGGSTGQPLRFYVENSFWWWNAALEYRGREWHGVRQGDKCAWVLGTPRDMREWSRTERLKAALLQTTYLNAFSMTEDNMQAFAELLIRWRPIFFVAIPSALTVFARYVQEKNITGIRPRLIETIAEKVTVPQRRLFEEVFQCRVVDYYSARELGAIAYECEAGGLHVCETRLVETIANGRPVQPGQIGKIVATSLTQFLMPLIRYENNDMGILEASGCSCGRSLPLLSEIVGRTHDLLMTTSGQWMHGLSVDHIFRVKPEVERYQVYQPDRYHLEVRLVCRQSVDQAWLEAARSELQARFGADMQISLQLVEDIALTPAGKHRYIISDVTPDM